MYVLGPEFLWLLKLLSFAPHVVTPQVCAGSGFANIWVTKAQVCVCLQQRSQWALLLLLCMVSQCFSVTVVPFLPSALEELGDVSEVSAATPGDGCRRAETLCGISVLER